MTEMTGKEKRAYRRRLRAWRLIRRLAAVWLRIRCGFSCSGTRALEAVDGPMIVLINHTNALDPLFTGVAFRRPLSFVASEHLLRLKPWGPLLNRYFCLIPHQKGHDRNGTGRVCLEHIARGESVFLCAEGEQTWDGISGRSKPHTGSLVKKSGATLVTYRIEGGYLARPRWSRRDRRGKVRAYPVHVYRPEALARMREEQIEQIIDEDLAFDIWQWQRSQAGGPVRFKEKHGEAAVGLEKAVCACPSCGRIGDLRTVGDTIACSCGFSARWSETGFFEPSAPFETIVDWEAYDSERIGQFLREEEGGWPADAEVTLRLISIGHRDAPLCRGELALEGGSRPALAIGTHRFALADIESMAMILDKRIVFTADGHYYELRAEQTNLRKYLMAWKTMQKGEG